MEGVVDSLEDEEALERPDLVLSGIYLRLALAFEIAHIE